MSGFQLRPTPIASNHPPAAGVSATPAKTTTATMMPTPLQKTPGGISTVGNTHIHTHTDSNDGTDDDDDDDNVSVSRC
jgi:hypothetical protein